MIFIIIPFKQSAQRDADSEYTIQIITYP